MAQCAQTHVGAALATRRGPMQIVRDGAAAAHRIVDGALHPLSNRFPEGLGHGLAEHALPACAEVALGTPADRDQPPMNRFQHEQSDLGVGCDRAQKVRFVRRVAQRVQARAGLRRRGLGATRGHGAQFSPRQLQQTRQRRGRDVELQCLEIDQRHHAARVQHAEGMAPCCIVGDAAFAQGPARDVAQHRTGGPRLGRRKVEQQLEARFAERVADPRHAHVVRPEFLRQRAPDTAQRIVQPAGLRAHPRDARRGLVQAVLVEHGGRRRQPGARRRLPAAPDHQRAQGADDGERPQPRTQGLGEDERQQRGQRRKPEQQPRHPRSHHHRQGLACGKERRHHAVSTCAAKT